MNKKVVLVLGIIITLCLVIGGSIYMRKKYVNITENQQINVATWIARSYYISEITFLKVSKDNNTGSITLYLELNESEKFKTGITVNDMTEFDTPNGLVGLNPVSVFEKLRKSENKKDAPVDLEKIEIKFIRG
ncbi:hypothetical protein A5821_003258 [Enterococcus sp. 7F3_DIV0205]|uniref:DUF1433 domain-containing protein n=1 Tax=Candidatus Enterococcus palustris TaxID=1834189 RepID=A0AAQ3WB71_9ENTE|nr:hypothetical protein [Enterococcus sp. 7F3_DIV0205]OTN84140.1 hypothetical protein A5821_000066 [Enterococcus sp. 7F3_DIV0205]